MKEAMIALAIAGLCSTTAFGMMDTDTGLPPTGGYGGSYGDAYGGGGSWGGGGFAGGSLGFAAFESAQLPQVTVTCSKVMCSTSSTFVGGVMLVHIGQSPLPPSPRAEAGEPPLTPEQQNEKKKTCLEGCEASNRVNLNLCAEGAAALNRQIADRPLKAGVGGAVAGGIAKGPAGAVAGGFVAWTMANQANEKILSNYTTNCLATAGRNNNYCIEQTCRAWFLAPLTLLPMRRRRRDEEPAIA